MNTDQPLSFLSQCPIPIDRYPMITMAHGGGGRLMNQLIEQMFAQTFQNSYLLQKHDSAVLPVPTKKIAMTTDTYTVSPLFFPGGDIGTLAVYGTVNDLAMSGATPAYLSLGFILEEGLPMEILWRVVQSIQKAAANAGVAIVTGDTKVVERGKGDGIYINSSGVGFIEHDLTIQPTSVKPGDSILINGDVGRHGMAIMAQRDGLRFESEMDSDCAPLHTLVRKLIDEKIQIHMLRDLTRGGLVSALHEISQVCGRQISIEESKVPVEEAVVGACEILGFDPLYVANEGKLVCIVAKEEAQKALAVMRNHEQGTGSQIIGQVQEAARIEVVSKNQMGSLRVLDLLSGEQLPRIC